MNRTNYNNLKFRIRLWFACITLIIFAVSAFPIAEFWFFTLKYFDINPDTPLRPQENSTLFLVCTLIFSLVTLFLSTLFVTWLVAKVYGYSKQQCIDYFFRYENLPKHWLKRER